MLDLKTSVILGILAPSPSKSLVNKILAWEVELSKNCRSVRPDLGKSTEKGNVLPRLNNKNLSLNVGGD